ncbi:MAG: hypothetical protein B6U76_10165 [Desulfurococcales archaeon ex4484_217_2]|nr:MAG: hypothetical protein B6U76_10165 [Desulfurococcales archaeon ex4484_217_2]
MKITLKRKNNIKFRCTKCGRTFTRPSIRCPYCSSLVRAEIPKQKEFKLTKHPGIWKFSNYLPKIPSENIISLDEGFTPKMFLLRTKREIQQAVLETALQLS